MYIFRFVVEKLGKNKESVLKHKLIWSSMIKTDSY